MASRKLPASQTGFHEAQSRKDELVLLRDRKGLVLSELPTGARAATINHLNAFGSLFFFFGVFIVSMKAERHVSLQASCSISVQGGCWCRNQLVFTLKRISAVADDSPSLILTSLYANICCQRRLRRPRPRLLNPPSKPSHHPITFNY